MSLLPRLLCFLLACSGLTTFFSHVGIAQSANDLLTVNVSEDAFEGNAVFTVSVDKKKVGSNLTATAIHNEGESQDFTLSGSWGPGAHTVTVRFLNDAYGGSPEKDRNLYVNQVMYNGVVSSKANIEIKTTGGVDFPVLAASPKLTLEPGVNLSGLEVNSTKKPGVVNYDYTAPTPSELDYYAAKGIKVVRLPILWERLQPSLLAGSPTTELDMPYLNLITSLLTYASTKGMGVIVDLHNYGAYNAIKIGAANGVSIGQFASSWQQFATALKGYPGLLGYDLMNEPSEMPSSAIWPAAAQAATTAIRKVDDKTPILVEGDDYASAGSWQTVNGSLNILDPSSSIIYEAHVYGDRDNSGTHFDWTTEVANGVTVETIAQRVSVFDAWCRNNARTCMVGEVGVGNDNPSWNTELENGLAQMKSDGLVMATYWAGGPWWGGYPMSIEPTGGIDAPQMAVLSLLKN